MMNRVLLILSLCFSFNLMAQRDVYFSVQVMEEQHKDPLIGAAIQIHPGNINGISDNNGMFSARLNTGSYTLEISYLGYESVNRSFRIDSSIHTKVYLSAGEVELDEITIRSPSVSRLLPTYISQAALHRLPAFLG